MAQSLSLYEDNCGGVMLDVLNHWKANPISGHKLDAYCFIDTSSRDDIYDSVWLFGAAYIGLALPLSAQRQESWDVVGDGKPGSAEVGSWGGKCVIVCSVMPEGLIGITDGTFKHMTWNFWGQYCDEAYACINKSWASANGKAPSGFDFTQLQTDLASL